MKVGVVGSGISGIFSSYLLSRRHNVTLYEKRERLGGHSHTVDVRVNGSEHPVDTGFIVYNRENYPNFQKFLDELDVATRPTSMSFSFRDELSDTEYGGQGIAGFFAQRKNLYDLSHWRMLLDIVRFYFLAPTLRERNDPDTRLDDYLQRANFGSIFIEDHLIPMISAIWSVPLNTARNYPLGYVVDFFENHGLLKLWNRPRWRTVQRGSREYLRAFRKRFNGRIRTGDPIRSVRRNHRGVTVVSKREKRDYDAVVLAGHSEQSLVCLEDPRDDERSILGSIGYESNDLVLHTDRSVLPKNESIWSSWNYHRNGSSETRTTLTYNMNILQDLPFDEPVCLTLNGEDKIDPDTVLDRFSYSHPVYDSETLAAQKRRDEICGRGNVYYAGSYWGDGFHEDGVESAIRVAEKLGIEWSK